MKVEDLLGAQLKSKAVIDLLELLDVPVVYAFDRSDEGMPDEYHAKLPELGLQLGFDAGQILKTIHVMVAGGEGCDAADLEDLGIPRYGSTIEVLASTGTGSDDKACVGRLPSMGIEYVRIDQAERYIHYEFRNESLWMVTLGLR